MSQILTTLGGTFTSCACGRQQFGGTRDCVFAQMSRFVCDRSRFTSISERVMCSADNEHSGPVSSMPTPMSSPSTLLTLPTLQTLDSSGIKNKPAKRAKSGKTDLGPMVGWTAEGPYVGIQGLSNGNGHVDAGPRSTASSLPPTPSSPFSSTLKLPVPKSSSSANVNSKAWASVVGLYDAPRPVTTSSSSSASQFRPDPSSTSSNSVLMSPSPRSQTPIYDRSNLPKISTSLPVSPPAPFQQQQQSYFPSMTGKPPSPRHWMSMSLASRGNGNGVSSVTTCPSPILESPETAIEEGNSYPFPIRRSPAPTMAASFDKGVEVISSAVAESADVDVVMSECDGPTVTEQQRSTVDEVDEPVKLPPRMRKRMKSSGSGSGGGLVSEVSNTSSPLNGDVDGMFFFRRVQVFYCH